MTAIEPRIRDLINSSKFKHDFHPASTEFDLMDWDELTDLATDIRKNGLKEKIELFEGKILDGRNRYTACLLVKVVPEFVKLPEDTNPISHVISKNVLRRHLSKAKRYKYGLKYLQEERIKAKKRQQATQFAGRDENNKPIRKASVSIQTPLAEESENKGRSIKKAAKAVGLGSESLAQYEKIAIAAKTDENIKEDLNKIENEELSVGDVFKRISTKKPLNRRKDCTYFRAAACRRCYCQLMACKLDLQSGNLILRKECPENCKNFEE